MPSNPTPGQIRADIIARSSLLSEAAQRRGEGGVTRARSGSSSTYTPVANLLIDAALGLANDEVNLQRASRVKEVAEREQILARCASHVVSHAVDRDYPVEQYVGDTERLGLSRKLTRDMLVVLRDKDYLSSLTAVTFGEVMIVAGGAVGALHDAGITQNEAEIISRSPLLDTSMVPLDPERTYALRDYLGEPYAHREHFVVSPDEHDTVTFTQAARGYIHNLRAPGRGCPAWNVPLGNTTLIGESWDRIVDYLVPDGVTVDTPNYI